MIRMQRHILWGMVLCSIILFPTVIPYEASKGNDNNLSDGSEVNAVDIPTWAIGDTWVFQTSVDSNTENGIFHMTSTALTFYVQNLTSLLHNNESVDVYWLKISGLFSGTFENATISGDVSGEIIGDAFVRQADLSLIDLNISLTGNLTWLFLKFEIEMTSVSSYTPSFEYVDFPLIVGETWLSSATVHQNSSLYIEYLYDNQTESTEQVNGVVTCDAIENIMVPAGNFTTYHILSEENDSTIESWYNSSVKNMVKFYLYQNNETSTNIVYLNLSSSTLQSQQIQVSLDLIPSVANVGDIITLSGSVVKEGSPIDNADITINIPYTGELYSTNSNSTGHFVLTIQAPLLLDPTHTTYDLGSDGICITAEYEGNNGYVIGTLTVTGIAIMDVLATPNIQQESQSVNITCHIYSVEPLNEKRVNISGPSGFDTQNVTLFPYTDNMYYFSQTYSIIGEYSYYIWVIDESGNSRRSMDYSFHIISQNVSIDVNQSTFDRGFPIRHALDGDWASAQSFMPTLSSFTSTEIYMRKFGTPEFNLTVELRENHPQGTLIDMLIFTPAEVPSSWTWFMLDFTDTPITSGTQYFIICPPAPQGVTTSFGYEWGYAFGNQYNDGAFWFTRDGGGLWRDLPTMYEFTFKTYGAYIYDTHTRHYNV